MSNLKKTSADIKKKLSFNDYSTPVSKHENKKAQQEASIPTQQPTGKPVQQQIAEPVEQLAAEPVSTHTATPAKQQSSGSKTKATYYLGKKEREMITTMYIKQLKKNGKADRSALVCEAIRLLYEREK